MFLSRWSVRRPIAMTAFIIILVMIGAYFYPKLCRGEIRRMLFVPTGALMSPTTSQQGQSIPGIAHGVVIEGCKRAEAEGKAWS